MYSNTWVISKGINFLAQNELLRFCSFHDRNFFKTLGSSFSRWWKVDQHISYGSSLMTMYNYNKTSSGIWFWVRIWRDKQLRTVEINILVSLFCHNFGRIIVSEKLISNRWPWKIQMLLRWQCGISSVQYIPGTSFHKVRNVQLPLGTWQKQ